MLLCCALAINTASAQDFEKGGNYVTLGYGLDPWGNPAIGGVGFFNAGYKKSTIGPIMLTYERGVTDVLGIGRIGAGGAIVQTFYNQKYTYSTGFEDTYNRSRIGVIARATYHFEFDIPKMDVYAGVGGGVYFNSDKDKITNFLGQETVTRTTSVSGGHYVFAGIRYYFTDAFGVYAEAGHGVSALSGGIAFKF